MTKQIITVSVGATVEVVTHSFSDGQSLRYSSRETVDIKYSSLDDAIAELNRIKKKYEGEYSDMSFDTIRDCGCYNECSCSPTMFVTGKRLENDVEYDVRLSEAKRHKKAQEERDRSEFDRLSKQFGKK